MVLKRTHVFINHLSGETGNAGVYKKIVPSRPTVAPFHAKLLDMVLTLKA